MVLTHFASYGYIVAGVDLLWPLIGGAESPMFPGPKSVFEVIQWVSNQLLSYRQYMYHCMHVILADFIVEIEYSSTPFVGTALRK